MAMKSFFAVSAVLMATGASFVSCSTGTKVSEQNDGASRDIASPSIDQIANRLSRQVKAKEFSLSTCSRDLDSFYQEIFNAQFGDLAQGLSESKALAAYETLFGVRAQILEKFRSWHSADLSTRISEDCVNSVRTALRAIRVVEDYLLTEFISPSAKIEEPNWNKLQGRSPELIVNPLYSEFRSFDRRSLKSGDVILSRGNAFTSATISRLGNVDYPFSHAAIVYYDEKEKKYYTVEAHIESGSVVAGFTTYLSDDKVRATVYRYRDPVIAARAAREIYTAVKTRQDQGNNIQYDFAMNGKDDAQLFCSELVSVAFRRASSGAVQLPLYESSLSKTSGEFKKRLGITAREAFLPGDIEVDPRFVLVAEWRDTARLRMTRVRDVALTQMLSWMGERKYKLHHNLKAWAAKNIVQPLRHWPIIGEKFLGEKFPKNMSGNVLATMSILQTVSTPIIDELAAQDERWVQKLGRRMTPREMTLACDRLREVDYERYRKGGKSLFHKRFRP